MCLYKAYRKESTGDLLLPPLGLSLAMSETPIPLLACDFRMYQQDLRLIPMVPIKIETASPTVPLKASAYNLNLDGQG
jgi:hypothetical protein